jgi:pilus assembly protein CpaE
MQEPEISALLIAPHRELAQQFAATLGETRAFQVLADVKAYPTRQALEIRLRQLKPEVVLLDLASDLAAATDLIAFLVSANPPVHVVGLHLRNDSEAILASLRAGASEFLYAPFDPGTQREALQRLRRLRKPEGAAAAEAGRVIAFASTKPGSGASTLATQTAFSLQRSTGKRVLLVDLDLMGGTIGFYLKLSHPYSLVDALQHADHLDPALWTSLAANSGGVDILPSPAAPYADPIDPGRLQLVLEHSRRIYDWVVLDLPAIFDRRSLVALTDTDGAYLVSTAELPSLHLTRRALNLIDALGFPRERFQVVVNRMSKRDGITTADMEKLFGCPVHASFPNDYFALHRVVTLGQPLGRDGELGRAIEQLTAKMTGRAKPAAGPKDLKPAFAAG